MSINFLDINSGPSLASFSTIRLEGGNGRGSTSTNTRRFSTIITNSGGSDITLSQSSSDGDSFTINTDGVYSISFGDGSGAAGYQVTIAKNTAGNTAPGFIGANLLALVAAGTGGNTVNGATTVPLVDGDVIRMLTDTSITPTGVDVYIQISRLA